MDWSGYSVSNAGDVNGDGFDDVIIGARHADPTGGDAGASYVLFGEATGFTTPLSLSNLSGSNGFKIQGEASTDRSGFSVSAGRRPPGPPDREYAPFRQQPVSD